jgi:hypothetical protein
MINEQSTPPRASSSHRSGWHALNKSSFYDSTTSGANSQRINQENSLRPTLRNQLSDVGTSSTGIGREEISIAGFLPFPYHAFPSSPQLSPRNARRRELEIRWPLQSGTCKTFFAKWGEFVAQARVLRSILISWKAQSWMTGAWGLSHLKYQNWHGEKQVVFVLLRGKRNQWDPPHFWLSKKTHL